MIRNASEQDLPALAAGMVRLQQLHVDAFPNIYKPFSEPDAISYLTDILSRPEFHVRVAVHSGQLAGHAVLAVESTESNMFKHAQQFGHITQIEVDPKFRRRGIGRQILDDTAELSLQLGLNRILLDVWAFNGAGLNFFLAGRYKPFGSKLVRTVGSVG